jgi:hypothetical protein
MIKIADTPGLRAQLERGIPAATVVMERSEEAKTGSTGETSQDVVAPCYPARNLVLKNGRYHVGDVDK